MYSIVMLSSVHMIAIISNYSFEVLWFSMSWLFTTEYYCSNTHILLHVPSGGSCVVLSLPCSHGKEFMAVEDSRYFRWKLNQQFENSDAMWWHSMQGENCFQQFCCHVLWALECWARSFVCIWKIWKEEKRKEKKMIVHLATWARKASHYVSNISGSSNTPLSSKLRVYEWWIKLNFIHMSHS